MLYTNKSSTEKFYKEFNSQCSSAKKLIIASGYFGVPLIAKLKNKILSITKKGECKILIGMVYHSGVTNTQNRALVELDDELRKINPNNGIYISRREYHGKIYHFVNDGGDSVYLGSSNFSEQGFKSRWEATVKIDNPVAKKESIDYLDFLFSQNTTERLSKVNLRRNKSVTIVKPSKLLKNFPFSLIYALKVPFLDFKELPFLSKLGELEG